MSEREDFANPSDERSGESGGSARPKKVTFDDFQIQKRAAQAQVDDEKRAWQERQARLDAQKPGFLRFAVPRLRSLKDDMIGGKKKLSSLFGRPSQSEDEQEETPQPFNEPAEPYFAEHEKLVIRVTPNSKQPLDTSSSNQDFSMQEDFDAKGTHLSDAHELDQQLIEQFNTSSFEEEYPSNNHSTLHEESDYEEESAEQEYEEYVEQDAMQDAEEPEYKEPDATLDITEEGDEEEEYEDQVQYEAEVVEHSHPQPSYRNEQAPTQGYNAMSMQAEPVQLLEMEPQIEPALMVFLDALRSFDSHPKRAHEPRDPRQDFVALLNEMLDILREQVTATSAMFFWVNNKKQQLVLESASMEDTAHLYLSDERKFPIELDAISRVVSRSVPELLSSVPAQAELDLIPYYTEAIGIASFAAMPVLFGNSLVAVLTVDSLVEENFSPETLRIMSVHSRVISGLIKSYIEKYDLLSSARTLESARKLHQIVSPDTSLRTLRDQRRTPEWILRALSEAASEIIDWEWMATVSFDENRRIWSVNALQSKNSGAYVPPQTAISLNESIVGKCLQTGRSAKVDVITSQHIRYSLEEDRQRAQGHSFLTIPIRTTNKNYGVLTIEHSEKSRFSEADVETLEHLARSAAAALEITALSDIVAERALTDLLTGILNRRGFMQRLNEELARAMEFDEPLTVAIFEVDGAADFFARFSQEDSDTIVLAVTRLLKFGSRPFDVVARIGEHTFAALLIRMPDEEGYLWSEKMRKMIVSEVIAIGKRSFSVTVSVGVAGARRDATVEELMEGAEMAIERAKELGGNNVIVY